MRRNGADDADVGKAVRFDPTVAHQARIYDYWLGGCFL
ncbi:MAG: SAM-dependent methyltransferase [Streptosporangiaceae bacterium]|nr:SAM-dependent methyltransferase [Streptosporangiaceae bacterium]